MSQQQFKKLLAQLQQDPKLTTTINTHHHQGCSLQIIDFTPIDADQNQKFDCSGMTFLKDITQNKIQCCRRGSPLLEQCRSENLPLIKLGENKGMLTFQSKDILGQKDWLRQSKLQKMSVAKGIVELIKVEWPYGTEIQVSYSPSFNSWILSNSKETLFCPLQEGQNQYTDSIQLKKLFTLWKKQQENCKDLELLKKVMSQYTFCGKVNLDWSQMSWYSVVETCNMQSICEDLFDAKSMIEKVGFSFARIKTVSMLNNEDQKVRVLEKLISSVEGSFCESRQSKFGRCKVYLVTNNSKQVLGGFDILTLQDYLYEIMRQLCFGVGSEQEKRQCFEEICLQFKNKQIRFPFPLNHYLQLFTNIIKLIAECGITEKCGSEDWILMLKLVLYLYRKGIQIKKFGGCFYSNTELKRHLTKISMQEFGPINCQITTIYCFINPSLYLRELMMQSLGNSFKQLDLHFEIVKCSSQHQICIGEIVDFIGRSQNNDKLNHYFIDSVPRLFQLKCLIKELQLQRKDERYYKLGIIVEDEELFVNVDENIYPFSMASLVTAYHEAVNRKHLAKKLSEKAMEMMKTTDLVEGLKNEEFKVEDGLIKVKLQLGRQKKEAESAVESILKKQKGDSEQPYYLLMVQLGKREFISKIDFSSTVDHIISSSYYRIKSLTLNQ